MSKNLYNTSAYNRRLVLKAKRCSCFCCLRSFSPNIITKWVDSGETAVCPFCAIDSILCDVDEQSLKEVNEFAFSETVE